MTRPGARTTVLFSLALVLAGCGPRHAATPANVVAEFPLGEASIGELQAAMTIGSIAIVRKDRVATATPEARSLPDRRP